MPLSMNLSRDARAAALAALGWEGAHLRWSDCLDGYVVDAWDRDTGDLCTLGVGDSPDEAWEDAATRGL